MTEQAKKRGRDADAAREAILSAAEEAFAQKGFDGARIKEIADACGYSNSLIVHHYFHGKEELYHAVMRSLKDERMERLRQIMTPSDIEADAPLNADAVQTFIEESVRLSFNQLVEHPKLARILAWEIAGCWKTFNELQPKPGERRWVEEIDSFIRRAQAAGIIRPELDPKMLITNVMGISLIYLLSLPRYQALFPDSDLSAPEALAHAREHMVNLIVHGILVHPKETSPDATGL